MKKYDVIVIGSGGGTKLVTPVAKMGYKVAIIEMDKLGGTCLNHGCIPSKMLIHVADVATAIEEAERFDLKVPAGKVEVNFEKLVNRVCETIDADSASIEPLYDKNPNVDTYRSEARFIDKKTLRVEGEEITADKIFIACGGRPAVPNIPGLKGTPFMTYMEALRNTKQPKKLIVLGGGYIAMELGYFHAALGTETHFIVREKMIRNEDRDVQEEFTKHFKYPVHLGWSPEEISHDGSEFTVKCNKGTLTGDALLVATGMKPWTDILGLDKTDIKMNERGYIEVDDHLRTSQSGVWAFGDCIGRNFFRHSANFEGEYLFNTLFKEPSMDPIVYRPMPHAMFTRPQLAGVGKTEQQLEAEGANYVVGMNPYRKSGMGQALLAEYGFVKLIFDVETRQLIGAHIIGEEASDMIHMCIVAMNFGATVDDLRSMIYVHPALPEVVRNAARNAPL